MQNMDDIQVLAEADAQILLPKMTRYSGLEVLLPALKVCVWETKDLTNLCQVHFGDQDIA